MNFERLISVSGLAIEGFGVLVIVIGSMLATVAYIRQYSRAGEGSAYTLYRKRLGRSIVLGLEFLIAGDIIRTVIVADSPENVAVLGMIILIRTFLSFTLHVEIEGRWPWQGNNPPADN